MNQGTTMGKINYGVDAPNVIRYLIFFGILLIVLVLIFPVVKMGGAEVDTRGFIWSGLCCVVTGCLMLFYSLKGKYYHRDRMLGMINWEGDEQVLDVGTGLGLLMIGAAKKLTTGKSVGIDVWNETDLSHNNQDNAMKNATLEGVAAKVEVLNENAMKMSFADETFDVVLSNLCIHNIYDKPGRLQACLEIDRVLKKGGTAVISDFRHIQEYKYNFTNMGLDTKIMGANYLMAFPPLNVLVVSKK
ncbi:MAG: class I SAM-dependent methyltransferase [Bacteroidota bacterium]